MASNFFRKETLFLVSALVVFTLSAAVFFTNLYRYSEVVAENLMVERKITKIDRIYKNYLSAVIEKRGYQFDLNKESLERYVRINETNQQLIKGFEAEVQNQELKQFYLKLVESNLERRNFLSRHLSYLDSMPQELAIEKIKSENKEVLVSSIGLERAFENILDYLETETIRLEAQVSELTFKNNIGFGVLSILVLGAIVGTFYQTRKNTLLEAEREKQDEILSITRNSELQFSASFHLAAIGMGLVSHEGKWLKVNQSLTKMLGYSEEEMLQMTFQEITHPEDLFIDIDLFKKVLDKSIESYSIEKRYFSKSGEILWINLNAVAVWKEDGSLRHFIAQIENISSRKLAFQALEQQKNRVENIIRGTNAGTWEWNVQTGATIYNETWAEIIGYRLEELEPVSIETWVKFTHPDDLKVSNKLLQKCFRGESEYYECECRMKHKDGHWVWVLDRGKVMTWTYDGKPEMMFGTHTDITKFKTLEEELLQKESFLNAMLDTIDVGIMVCNEEGELKLFNKATLDLFSLDLTNIPQSEWASHFQLLQLDGQAVMREEEMPLHRVWKGEQVENQIFCIRHSSGEILYISASGSQIRDERGKIQGAVVALKDITDGRKAALELEERERKYKGIFNSTFQFIGFLDPDGTLKEANQTALSFAGLNPENVIGKKFWDSYWWQISQETKDQLRQSIERAAQGEFIQYEVAVWDKDKNPVTILFNLKPLFDGYGEVVAIIPEGRLVQDIVDARKSLIEKNKELERFASVASHDLKEPLRMVINFLQLLEKKYKGQLDDKADQYIHFAVDASLRMNVLISDLLEFSKIGNENTLSELIDINRVVEEQEAYFSASLEECGGKISYTGLPKVIGKKVAINLLFRNLIGNAIKYRKQDVSPLVLIKVKEFPDYWEFSVEDNGIGFEPEYSQEIFELFKRLHTRQEYSGTGLGLAICRKITEQHDGKIWVDSLPGRGSIFYFTLSKTKFQLVKQPEIAPIVSEV